MSDNSLAFTPARNWGLRNEFRDTAASSPEHDTHWRRSTIPWPLRHRTEEGGVYSPWRLFEERVRTGPYGLTRFPSQPHSPIRVLILDGGTEERVNPGLRQFIRDSPPRIRGEWHLGPAPRPQESGLTDEEFKKAMKKLKKQVYNPPYPKKSRAQKRGLFSNWSNSSSSSSSNNNIAEGEESGQGKECAICLEAFVAAEQVLVTPCNHMFHNDCLVPWVKSQGQCPVCRFALGERREAAVAAIDNSSYGYNNMVDAREETLADVDLISLIRAMEEALNWVALSH